MATVQKQSRFPQQFANMGHNIAEDAKDMAHEAETRPKTRLVRGPEAGDAASFVGQKAGDAASYVGRRRRTHQFRRRRHEVARRSIREKHPSMLSSAGSRWPIRWRAAAAIFRNRDSRDRRGHYQCHPSQSHPGAALRIGIGSWSPEQPLRGVNS